MLKEAVGSGGWTRVCDSCRAAACAVYCQADSAYLCIRCDTCIHAVNSGVWMHERVLVCEACECAPASFSCKADAAALCISCDAKIHSANALARRHHRIPILPITGFLREPTAAHPGKHFGPHVHVEDGFLAHKVEEEEEEEDETTSWLLLNPVKNKNQSNNGFLFGNEVEEYLDLDEYNSCTENNSQYYVNDSVVPVQCGTVKEKQQQQEQQQNLQSDMEFEASKSGFNYTTSISHSVSFSSVDTSVVPDTANVNEISNSHVRPPKGTIDLFSSPPFQMPTQFSSVDREARVLRYREKRKTRKFEKTIRYASRKAYAETRPRIKGRFAKRTDAEFEVDQMFSSTLMSENGYGVVPSF
ncbi:zinc finger protein [Macleaya cordata]|uniref:Zinc finger protein n=1 Tax=Macleaya cordata TaxID=56857 RepID=A0A200QPY0_MACCD|nr:zinc finger protein [Macleaya cordata]